MKEQKMSELIKINFINIIMYIELVKILIWKWGEYTINKYFLIIIYYVYIWFFGEYNLTYKNQVFIFYLSLFKNSRLAFGEFYGYIYF